MTEDARSLARRIQDQSVSSARDFFGASLGRLRRQLRGDRSQLEEVAGQLREEEARTRVRELIDSYAAIEDSIEEAARGLGLEDTVDEAAGREPEERVDQRAQETVGKAAQGARDAVTGTIGRAAEVAGQVAGQVGQVAENLPGGRLLSRTTDESGLTVQRLVDESGDIIETNLDDSSDLLDETLVGNLKDLPSEEEYQNEEGQTIRTVKDESGTVIELRLDPDGDILGLEVSPDA